MRGLQTLIEEVDHVIEIGPVLVREHDELLGPLVGLHPLLEIF
jgi:hypothetical protein